MGLLMLSAWRGLSKITCVEHECCVRPRKSLRQMLVPPVSTLTSEHTLSIIKNHFSASLPTYMPSIHILQNTAGQKEFTLTYPGLLGHH